MIHGSYGTLGLLTAATFRLIPAKKFVRMEYRKFSSFDGFSNEMKARISAGDFDFIDGVIHSPTELVLCLGKMTDSAPYESSYKWLNIFYKSTRTKTEDYLGIEDYFFRYDTECHWLTKTVPFLETKAARLVFGRFVLGSTNLIKWSKRLAPVMRLKKRPDVVVDVFIPSARFGEFFEWYKTKMNFYPLWIVPYRPEGLYPWIDSKYAGGIKGELFIDCAIYGKSNSEPDVDYSELLEKKTIELNGIKTLISRNHFDEESFWKVYNKEKYLSVKNQTDPDGLFMDLYKKFSPERYK
jgi:FAD/FMN-containing dehydrogenase